MFPKIKKAVFPVAGIGTRFLPATKANPKEMMPIVDKPLIQYAVEEAMQAGITELIFVTSQSKRAIEDHFDSNFELEMNLRSQGKEALIPLQQIVPEGVRCIYVRQPQALGLGHAVYCAKEIIGNEPFAVLLADDLIDGGTTPCLAQMMALYHKTGASVLAVENISIEETEKYGVVKLAHNQQDGQIVTIVEKPKAHEAPSTLGVVGRYILSPLVFKHLEHMRKGANGEVQLTDALAQLLKDGETIRALEFIGNRYDCGTKLGYLKATIAFGCQHPEVGRAFKEVLEKI